MSDTSHSTLLTLIDATTLTLERAVQEGTNSLVVENIDADFRKLEFCMRRYNIDHPLDRIDIPGVRQRYLDARQEYLARSGLSRERQES